MFRRLIIGLLSALALAVGLAGLVVPATASAATAKPAATPSKEYIALEVAKVPRAFHVVTGTGTTSGDAVNSAHSACSAYLAAAGNVFNGEDCVSAVYVQYGYVAISYANPDATTANGYAWGFGWGHTKATAIDYAMSTCKQYNGSTCAYGGYAVTPNYAGAEVTTGGSKGNPLNDAVTWALANTKKNPISGKNWITPFSACEQMVEEAYGTKYIYGTAYDDWYAQHTARRINSGYAAPHGALVFFTGTNANYHVGLAAGNGTQYYTVDGGTIHLAALSEGATNGLKGYLGWSYAPTSWPGR